MSGKSKQKGSAFERTICKQLGLWATNGDRDDLFWRSAMSGGRATVAHKAGRKNLQLGDITAVDPMGHTLTDRFVVECKAYKDLGWTAAVYSRKSCLIMATWRILVKIADAHDRSPMLIAKQNNQNVLVGVTHLTTKFLSLEAIVTFPQHDLVFVQFSELLSKPYPWRK